MEIISRKARILKEVFPDNAPCVSLGFVVVFIWIFLSVIQCFLKFDITKIGRSFQ
jgi:hypothetical protein